MENMNQRTWLNLELETTQAEFAEASKSLTSETHQEALLARYALHYWTGYNCALTNALNNLEGMAEDEPELPSHYLPGEIRNQTLTPETLERIAQDLRHQGISGLNVGLALDLITN